MSNSMNKKSYEIDENAGSQEVQSQVELYKLIGGSWPPAPIEPGNVRYGTVPRSSKPVKRTPSERSKSVNIVSHIVQERKKPNKSFSSFDKTKSKHNMADSKRIETGILVDIASSNGLSLIDEAPSDRHRTRSSPPKQLPGDIGVGSLVEVAIDVDKKHYGVVRWIGLIDDSATAGIELEESSSGLGDGCHGSRRLFSCAPGKALFVPLALCRIDSRFEDDSSVCDYQDDALPDQPECPLVAGEIPPLNSLGDLVGKNRGIQGHHNSCYLDATLFSMFTFTSVFDSLLYRPPEPEDCPQYSEVQRVLREEVVNPLRKHGYVRADRVMRLRTLLEKLSDVSGLTSEEKDPEEFLNGLVAQILRAEPFLKLSSGQESYCYQLFVEKDEQISLPTVQQLLEQSFATSQVKLTEVPATLIIQMPRFGKQYKLYPRLLPSPLLDVTDLIEGLPRQCAVCGNVSRWECLSCVGRCGSGLASTAFCEPCLRTVHMHLHHPPAKPLSVNEDYESLLESCPVPRVFMELFAVLCIETSHYVAFVKTGAGHDAPWCFFDSMADRKGERNGYNIPEIVLVEEGSWLSEEGARLLHESIPNDRHLPPQAKRLLCDAYMCFYRSPDVAMYR